ncbi:MAG: hypothetical protein NT027_04725, partial [Proteobacteria bacterium]|nr:hypothetical protein [Pseudomonadota bacterium]
LGLFWSNPLIYLLLAFGLPRGKVYDLLYRWLMLLTICTSAYLINIGIQVMTVQRHYFDGNLILLIYLPVLLLSLFGIFKPFSYDHILCFLSQIATRIYRIFLAPLYQRLANLLKLRWYVIFGLATLFASIWFLPFSSKMHCGEIGLIRFRFQVFTYDSTYVSRTTWSEFKEILIRFNVVKMPMHCDVQMESLQRTGMTIGIEIHLFLLIAI